MTDKKPHIVPPCHEDIEILFQDDFFLIINKPQPLLSTPGRLPENKDSAISRIQQSFPSAQLAHRLDMSTSGLMVIPLSKPVHAEISKQFQNRVVEKTYTAVLHGLVEVDDGEIDFPIITDWERRPLQKVCYETGKPSLTKYQVVERDIEANTTRVIFTPVTGRSHQLRIHSKEIGHPILGCELYRNDFSSTLSGRLLLHATTLAFYHPITQEKVHYSCPAPF